MRKAIIFAVGALLVMLATHHPANARRLPDGINAAQLRKGLAAFNRHDYTTAGQLLRTPAERGNPDAQAVLCFFVHLWPRGGAKLPYCGALVPACRQPGQRAGSIHAGPLVQQGPRRPRKFHSGLQMAEPGGGPRGGRQTGIFLPHPGFGGVENVAGPDCRGPGAGDGVPADAGAAGFGCGRAPMRKPQKCLDP